MIETYNTKRPQRSLWIYVFTAFILLIISTSLFVWSQSKAPKDFPEEQVVTIPRGLSASAISDLLRDEGVVKSAAFLYVLLVSKYDPASIQAGTYFFSEPIDVFEVAKKITQGSAGENLLSLTLPEGYTATEYARIAEQILPDFDSVEFLNLVKGKEGYLFPDTYFIPADFAALELAELLIATYEEKTLLLQEEIRLHPLGEGVIVLASILEREANTEDSMKMVSGILQNRLEDGMRLQVDASIEYVLNRPLNTLTPEDLEKDTPYNTYLYDGLPPTPIGNPGLQAINAVLNPIKSDYFYYITGDDGNFYYAKTFDEHRANVAKYLR